MKHRRIITSYFFQKTCYHGNHKMHSVASPKSKAFVLFREQVNEIFSNSYTTCYQEWSSKYVSLKKFCRAHERKNLLFHYCFFYFFPPTEFFKNWYRYHLIDLSCHQNFDKIHRLEAEILAHEIRNMEKVTVEQIPLNTCTKLFMHLIKFPRMRNHWRSIRTYSLWKRYLFPFDCLMGYMTSYQISWGEFYHLH